MGMPLAEMAERMSSDEFGLHMALEVARQEASAPKAPELDWCDGMD